MTLRSLTRPLALLVAASAVALSLTACTTAAPTATPTAEAVEPPEVVADASMEGLRILLTNDDSMQAARENNSDGLGLYEMRKALCAAGADVVVIAPWAVQSGRGTAVTNSGTFSAGAPLTLPAQYASDCADAPAAGAVFGLCLAEGACVPDSASGTPADTVKFAMRGGLEALVGWDERPDLVVSGPNAGLNVASSVNDSGTLGAAIAAVEHRVPAVAFSTASSEPGIYPVENYQATSEWAVALLQDLASRDMLAQHEFVVSVNYPNTIGDAKVGAARFVEVGSSARAYHYYTPAGDNAFKIGIQICEDVDICEESKDDADWVAVSEDNAIGITAIAPDRTYATEVRGADELAALRAFVTSAAPVPIP